MKRLFIIIALIGASLCASAQKAWFIGGTGQIGYTGQFEFALEPQFGYEFTDRWAIGTGLGMLVVAESGYGVVMGSVEPFARFTAWHNDLVYIDLKATTGFAFTDELVLAQLGIRPSLRFRINDHWDISADLGLFGAQCTYGDWTPALGLSATSAGLWFAYRF